MARKGLVLVIPAILVAAGLTGCKDGTPASTTQPRGSAVKAGQPAAPKGAPVSIDLSAPPAATKAMDAPHLARAQSLINGGLKFLLAGREASGGWSLGGGLMEPAITGLVLKALLEHPDLDRTSPVVTKGFDVMLSYRQKDGAIYDPKLGRPAYTTAIAIMALTEAKDSAYNEAIRHAVQYLKGIQIVPGQESPDGGEVAADSPRVGGVGYGKSAEPNLSVLGFAIEAWREAGIKPDDPAMQRAVEFLSRVQNRSESNPLSWAREGDNDGGFVYELDASKAGEGPGGSGLRSYGSMTYVGFKSMLYAGVDRSDPRVQAAYMWIRRYWRLDSNPNMPKLRSEEGLFYYYHVFAKALRAWGADEIDDLKGAKHNWRHELIDALAERVGEDGSWTNKSAKRWEEGNPVLSTCFGVLALEEAMRK
ncbi:MAG: prenyltransferase/squalene oxidase repeat-containing protein [Phycisphaerae bacterium]